MTISLACLLGFAAWVIALVTAVGVWRVARTVAPTASANANISDQPDANHPYWRLWRAHLNATENASVVVAVIVGGILAHAETPLFAWCAIGVVGFRVAQSIAHIASNAPSVIRFRFLFYVLQGLLLLVMLFEIARVVLSGS